MNIKKSFSPFNRLLGKKSKSKANLSKSMTNLSDTMTSTNAYDSSQMHQNRIIPVPAATSNSAFEQTFRITVLLPNKQLYVARLGARVALQKLLELVCEDKELHSENYEFRHPTDSGQVFSCDLAIGSVGLSKIRLCHKTDAYDTFIAEDNTDDSESVSEFSSRSCKQFTKTPNSYSSSKSENSVVNWQSNSSGVIVRKKRLAPKPPNHKATPDADPQPILRRDFYASSPNVSQEGSDLRISNESVDDIDDEESSGRERPMSMHILNQKVAALSARHANKNLSRQESIKNLSSNSLSNLPEGIKRKNLVRRTRQISTDSTEEFYATSECEPDVLSFLPSVQQSHPVAHPRRNI